MLLRRKTRFGYCSHIGRHVFGGLTLMYLGIQNVC